MAYQVIKVPGSAADVFDVEIRESGDTRAAYFHVINKGDQTSFGYSFRCTGASAGTMTLTSSPTASAAGKEVVTAEWVRNYVKTSGSVPIGSIIPWASNSTSGVPSGFKLCNGQAVSRTTYATLFELIGTSYGAGDGSSTFNLPDMNGRTLWGVKSNSQLGYVSAGLPNITGRTYGEGGGTQDYGCYTGAFYQPEASTTYPRGVGSADTDWDNRWTLFNAARCSSIYGNSSTVQPPSTKTMFIIRVS